MPNRSPRWLPCRLPRLLVVAVSAAQPRQNSQRPESLTVKISGKALRKVPQNFPPSADIPSTDRNPKCCRGNGHIHSAMGPRTKRSSGKTDWNLQRNWARTSSNLRLTSTSTARRAQKGERTFASAVYSHSILS